MKSFVRLTVLAAACLAAVAFSAPASAAESNEFRVARQPGLVYLQAIIMEDKKLIEKHAAALGLKDLKVSWSIITSGGVMTEAILSDSIDMATTGVSIASDSRRVPVIPRPTGEASTHTSVAARMSGTSSRYPQIVTAAPRPSVPISAVSAESNRQPPSNC